MSAVSVSTLLVLGYYAAAVGAACSLGAAARSDAPRRSLWFTAMTVLLAVVAVGFLRLYYAVPAAQ